VGWGSGYCAQQALGEQDGRLWESDCSFHPAHADSGPLGYSPSPRGGQAYVPSDHSALGHLISEGREVKVEGDQDQGLEPGPYLAVLCHRRGAVTSLWSPTAGHITAVMEPMSQNE
jgi:hypothetical protein